MSEIIHEEGSAERPTTVISTEEASVAIGLIHRVHLPTAALTVDELAVVTKIQALPRHSRIIIRRE